MEPVARLALPMAVAGSGGAAVVATMTRWWMLGPYHGPVAMIVAAAAGAWIGAMLTYSLRADPIRTTVRKGALGVAVLGPVCALLVSLVCDPREMATSAILLGAIFALALLPCLVVATLVASRAGRSRRFSIVGGSDRRAAWRATAVWLAFVAALGVLPGMVDGSRNSLLADTFWWTAHDKAELATAPLLVAFAACVIAAAVAFLDLCGEVVVTRAHGASAAWRVDDAGAITATLDVGIGHDAWIEHVTGRVTYRENVVERVIAVGDLAEGSELLRAATRRSVLALIVVLAAQVLALYSFAVLHKG